MNAIELKGVSYSINGRDILRDINFSSAENSTTAILGPSGVGKSTLLNLLAGFLRPDKGEICIGGKIADNGKTFVEPEKRGIGILFQDLALFPHMTVFKNIAFGMEGKSRAEKKERVEKIAADMEIDTLLDRYPHQLSGGQQQRLALARALAPCPKLLLMDEPFSHQDADLRHKLARLIHTVLEKEKIAGIMVTHDHDEAFLTDNMGILHDGQLLQFDSPYRIYHMPSEPFVANFVSRGCLISGKVIDNVTLSTVLGQLRGAFSRPVEKGDVVKLLVRPENVKIDNQSKIRGIVVEKSFMGSHYMFLLDFGFENRIRVFSTCGDYQLGDSVGVKTVIQVMTVFTDCPYV